MKRTFHFQAARLLLFLLALVFVVGCGSVEDGSGTDSTEQTIETELSEAQYLIGKWRVNEGRFGHKIFAFQADGRLMIEDVDTGQIIEMSYVFTGDNSITLSGYEEFDGAATLKFYENKLDFTINFAGTIFGEMYDFTREEAASN
jgi:hypothetical protein